ncbi:MAG TPA: trypsin-like peptidase domain-containing protein [Pirellulaceae bacterium]|nr:trypsin-like peptidase domain-containing protein [Pirellulaceae bacterium]
MTHNLTLLMRGNPRGAFRSWMPVRSLAVTSLALIACVLQPALVCAQQSDVQQTVTSLKPVVESESHSLLHQYDLVKQVIRTTQISVAHIEARKPRPTAAREVPAARKAFIEEAGSGVLIRYRGQDLVITNFHVIDGAGLNDITLIINDRLLKPVEVRHDRETDLSILLIEANTGLVPAALGNSDDVEMGEFVLALGSPFGLSQSVSQGILSAKHRRDLELGPRGVRYQDFFQTDAAINPGNSGGPLINLQGEVIAINSAIASNSGGSDGIGFSIPINMAMRVVGDLVDYGEVRRGHLGVTLDASFSPQVAAARGWTFAHGALVAEVVPNSPAAQAQVLVGDVILEFDGKRVGNDSHLVTLVSVARIGSRVPLVVFRDGQRQTIYVLIQQKGAVKKES